MLKPRNLGNPRTWGYGAPAPFTRPETSRPFPLLVTRKYSFVLGVTSPRKLFGRNAPGTTARDQQGERFNRPNL